MHLKCEGTMSENDVGLNNFYFNNRGHILDKNGRVVGKIYAPGLSCADISNLYPAQARSIFVHDIKTRNKQELKKHVEYLRTIKQPVQRSKEWYKMRARSLTASDLAGALGDSKYDTPFDILTKKCDCGKNFTGNSITQWGVKYEKVVEMIYSAKNHVDVIEFGLMPHPKIPFLAASPDGITTEGTMLEIKSPPKREITGTARQDYWDQMQLQLEVCDLEQCDFAECKFEEYRRRIDFVADFLKSNGKDCCLTRDGMQKGIIIELYDNKEGKLSYVYSPLNLSVAKLLIWTEEKETKYRSDIRFRYEKTTYYKVVKYSCITVKRDRVWFDSMFPKMKSFWREVCYYRTQPPEVLYADHGKSVPYIEVIEEEGVPDPGHISFLSSDDEDIAMRSPDIPEVTKLTKALSKAKIFISDSDED